MLLSVAFSTSGRQTSMEDAQNCPDGSAQRRKNKCLNQKLHLNHGRFRPKCLAQTGISRIPITSRITLCMKEIALTCRE